MRGPRSGCSQVYSVVEVSIFMAGIRKKQGVSRGPKLGPTRELQRPASFRGDLARSVALPAESLDSSLKFEPHAEGDWA
jgi:hypothetical protein